MAGRRGERKNGRKERKKNGDGSACGFPSFPHLKARFEDIKGYVSFMVGFQAQQNIIKDSRYHTLTAGLLTDVG